MMSRPKISIENHFFGTHPSIIHHPARFIRNSFFLEGECGDWVKLKNYFTKANFNSSVPDQVKVVLYNNRNKKSCLELNLDALRIKYEVIGNESLDWNNRKKIGALKKALPDVKEDFVLAMDSDDVLVVKDLSGILDIFLSLRCRMLINASHWIFPNESHYSRMEMDLAQTPFCHLNSGCFIAETKFLTSVVEDWDSADDEITRMFPHSDQVKLKPVYLKRHPEIKLDQGCELFQIMDLEAGNYMRILRNESARDFMI